MPWPLVAYVFPSLLWDWQPQLGKGKRKQKGEEDKENGETRCIGVVLIEFLTHFLTMCLT